MKRAFRTLMACKYLLLIALLSPSLSFASSPLPPASYIEQVDYYTALAKSGDSEAMYQLSKLYYTGRGTNQSKSESLKLLRMAASKGHYGALFDLSRSYRGGAKDDYDTVLIEPDEKVSEKFMQEFSAALEESAAQGDAEALLSLGKAHEYGHAGFEVDLDKALIYYREGLATLNRLAGKENSAKAQYLLGNIYNKGQAMLIKDSEMAEALWKKAAANGYVQAMNALAYHFKRSDAEDVKSLERRYILQAAELGSADAMRELAFYSRYREHNIAESLKWYLRAYPQLQYDGIAGTIADIYRDNEDFDAAKEWYLKDIKKNSNYYRISGSLGNLHTVSHREFSKESSDLDIKEWSVAQKKFLNSPGHNHVMSLLRDFSHRCNDDEDTEAFCRTKRFLAEIEDSEE